MADHSTAIVIAEATAADRDEIYRIRHSVYATELKQHARNDHERLRDDLDVVNTYLVARKGADVVGFISVTPPSAGRYSVDKYIPREALPFPTDDGLFEVRLLTVPVAHRARQMIASTLLYASLRLVESLGGTRDRARGGARYVSPSRTASPLRVLLPIRRGPVSVDEPARRGSSPPCGQRTRGPA